MDALGVITGHSDGEFDEFFAEFVPDSVDSSGSLFGTFVFVGVKEAELAFGELKSGDAHADETDGGTGFPGMAKERAGLGDKLVIELGGGGK